MATWTLVNRQRRLFTQTVDLYRPTFGAVNGEMNSVGYELVADSVPCYIESNFENSRVVDGLGRANDDSMLTSDKIRMPEILDDDGNFINIGDGWMTQLISGGGSENGAWQTIGGEAQNLQLRGATRVYMITRNTAPPVVAP